MIYLTPRLYILVVFLLAWWIVMKKFILGCRLNVEAYEKSVREKTTKCSLKTIEILLNADEHVLTWVWVYQGTVAPNYFKNYTNSWCPDSLQKSFFFWCPVWNSLFLMWYRFYWTICLRWKRNDRQSCIYKYNKPINLNSSALETYFFPPVFMKLHQIQAYYFVEMWVQKRMIVSY